MAKVSSRVWAGAAVGGAAAAAKAYLGRRGSATASSSAAGCPEALDAAWLTRALREGGLLAEGQSVERLELETLSGEPGDISGVGISGSVLLRARLEYSGPGDLGSLPCSAVLKLTDLAELSARNSVSWNRAMTLGVRALGVHQAQSCPAEHAFFRYLASDGVRGQPWALPAPALYFEHLEAPTEVPSQAAIAVGGAWTGSARPVVRSLLIMEDLSARGLAHFDQFDPADAIGAGRFAESAALAALAAAARWHAAHWGRRRSAGSLVRAAPLLKVHGLHFRVLGIMNVGWLARLKLLLATNASCPLVGAALLRHRDARPRGDPEQPQPGQLAHRPGGWSPHLWSLLGAALERPGVAAALRGVERGYGPVLASRIRERLHSGAAARRNRTLLHGDLHISNIMYAFQEGDQDSSNCADIRMLDFAQAGWGHVTYELLYLMRFWSEERLAEGAASRALEAYHAALAACSPPVQYSMSEFREDWSLAVVDWATLFLVAASDSAEKVLTNDWQTRQTARLLLMLEEVAESDTEVGRVLRRGGAEPALPAGRASRDAPRSRL